MRDSIRIVDIPAATELMEILAYKKRINFTQMLQENKKFVKHNIGLML
jgi:hypothetical protein